MAPTRNSVEEIKLHDPGHYRMRVTISSASQESIKYVWKTEHVFESRPAMPYKVTGDNFQTCDSYCVVYQPPGTISITVKVEDAPRLVDAIVAIKYLDG